MELRYRFDVEGGARKEFVLLLDPETLAYQGDPAAARPDWTRLEFKQCPNCPLKPAESPHCPVAANMAPLVDSFKDSISYDPVDVEVQAPGRSYRKRTTMQAGVSALFGIVMASSGCPILDKLRPMLLTHLPFPSLRETQYRAMSTYLLRQFFVARKGGKPDWTLKGLARIYDEINKVNVAFAERLRAIHERDASVNAVSKLDCFASYAATAIERSRGALDWLERLFRPSAEKPPRKKAPRR